MLDRCWLSLFWTYRYLCEVFPTNGYISIILILKSLRDANIREQSCCFHWIWLNLYLIRHFWLFPIITGVVPLSWDCG